MIIQIKKMYIILLYQKHCLYILYRLSKHYNGMECIITRKLKETFVWEKAVITAEFVHVPLPWCVMAVFLLIHVLQLQMSSYLSVFS